MGTKSRLNVDIKSLLADDKKIAAIKLVMSKLNLGLAKAKRYVDEIERDQKS